MATVLDGSHQCLTLWSWPVWTAPQVGGLERLLPMVVSWHLAMVVPRSRRIVEGMVDRRGLLRCVF